MEFERLDYQRVNWPELNALADRSFAQGRPWLDFLAATQRAEPVVAAIYERGERVGYFTGAIVRKFGLRLLGSPLPGWSTPYMGFNLVPGTSRQRAAEALRTFAFGPLKCVHLELMDRWLTEDEARASGFAVSMFRGYELDLSVGTERLFAGMEGRSRTAIRKAEKNDVTIEEANDLAFADDYFAQLEEVFAKRALVPTYNRQRVRALIEHVLASGQLLLLRARDAQGRCIATSLFPACPDYAYYWGAASWREFQNLCPNELIVWHALKYWAARGVRRFDFGGGGTYKEKFGGVPFSVPWVHVSKYPVLATLREKARKIYRLAQQWAGRRSG